MSDLRERVPGHALVERLLSEWQQGRIRYDGTRAIVDPEAQSWYRGVLGERIVARRLAALGDDWLVLHSVPVGRADTDIDHLAIGPTGVFTVNTKYSPGKTVWAKGYGLYVDGQKTGYVPRAIREARGVALALSRATGLTVPVMALIVFVDPGELSISARVGGTAEDPEVRVMADSAVLRAFAGRPVLAADDLERLRAVAIRPDTWHTAPRATAALSIDEEFAALEEAVGPELARPVVAPSRRGRAHQSIRRRLIGLALSLGLLAIVLALGWLALQLLLAALR